MPWPKLSCCAFSKRLRPHMTVSRSGTACPVLPRLLLLLLVELGSASATKDAGVRAQPIIIQVEVLEGHMGGEKATRGAWVLRPKALSFRLMVFSLGRFKMEVRKRGERFEDFVEQAAGEDIGEICNPKYQPQPGVSDPCEASQYTSVVFSLPGGSSS